MHAVLFELFLVGAGLYAFGWVGRRFSRATSPGRVRDGSGHSSGSQEYGDSWACHSLGRDDIQGHLADFPDMDIDSDRLATLDTDFDRNLCVGFDPDTGRSDWESDSHDDVEWDAESFDDAGDFGGGLSGGGGAGSSW